MPFGTAVREEGGVRFALGAPGTEQVQLEHGPGDAPVSHPMKRDARRWHRLDVAEASAGDRYRFRWPDGLCMPDPASRSNPDGIHSTSDVIDPRAFAWRDVDWCGRPWAKAVICELHIGTFTSEGNCPAAAARLAELVRLGITVVALMPLADFPSKRNRGYDGVSQFAPDASDGTPDPLKAFVDAAHGLGVMVLIDVAYNHFGPEGHCLHACCPQFFNPEQQTPWHAAIDDDATASRTVRNFFIHNPLYWVEEYRVDGLHMGAIHAVRDDSEIDIVHQVCTALRSGPGKDRAVHVMLENDLHPSSLLKREDSGEPEAGSAQWNDDLHHAAHVNVTGETEGDDLDYSDAPVDRFGRALAEGFVCQGPPSLMRVGVWRGAPCAHLPLTAFVSSMQTHDQIGSRAFGERVHGLSDPVLLHAACACLVLSPHVPVLFMGQEFGRFEGFTDEASRALSPDLHAESTFHTSVLRWEECTESPHREWLAGITELLIPHFGPMPLHDVMAPPGRLVYAHGIEMDSEVLRLATGAVRVTLQEHADV